MAHSITFDTLLYAKKAREAGFTEQQAEFQAEMLAEIIEDRVATKQDVLNIKSKLELKLAELKNELIRWVMGIAVAQAAIVISCIKLIH